MDIACASRPRWMASGSRGGPSAPALADRPLATLTRVSALRRILNRPLPPRVAIVQRELDRFRGASYLEVGVNVGVLFLHVRAARKVGVDPVQRIPRWKRLGHPNTALRGELV